MSAGKHMAMLTLKLGIHYTATWILTNNSGYNVIKLFSAVNLEQQRSHRTLQGSRYFSAWAKETEKGNLKIQIKVAWKITKSELLACCMEKRARGDIRMTTITRTSLKLGSTYVRYVHKLSKPDSARTVIRTLGKIYACNVV